MTCERTTESFFCCHSTELPRADRKENETMAFTPREPQNYSVLDAPRKSSNNINNESTTLEIRKDRQ